MVDSFRDISPDTLYVDGMCLRCERRTKIVRATVGYVTKPSAWCLNCRRYTEHSVNVAHTPQVAIRRVERVHVMQVSADTAKDVCDWINAIGEANGVDYRPSYTFEGEHVLVEVEEGHQGNIGTAESGWWIAYHPDDESFEVLAPGVFAKSYEILTRS